MGTTGSADGGRGRERKTLVISAQVYHENHCEFGDDNDHGARERSSKMKGIPSVVRRTRSRYIRAIQVTVENRDLCSLFSLRCPLSVRVRASEVGQRPMRHEDK